MKQQSIDAYHNLNRHRVNSQIGRILLAIRESEIPLCDRRIAVQTRLPLNVVESRLCSLEREGAIRQSGVQCDGLTGNQSRVWVEVNQKAKV
jgi:hypothetical protein